MKEVEEGDFNDDLYHVITALCKLQSPLFCIKIRGIVLEWNG